MDRFHLKCDVKDRVPGLAAPAAEVRRVVMDERAKHRRYITLLGEDMPDIDGWRWSGREVAPMESRTANAGADNG